MYIFAFFVFLDKFNAEFDAEASTALLETKLIFNFKLWDIQPNKSICPELQAKFSSFSRAFDCRIPFPLSLDILSLALPKISFSF